MKFLIALGLAGFLLPAKARGDACQIVAASRIQGRDLALAAPELAGLPPEADIGPAPLVGVERIFHTPELIRIARTYGLPPPDRTREICLVRKTVLFSEAQWHAAIVEAFGGSAPERPPVVEILDFSRLPMPEGKLEFHRGALAASGLWRGRVVTPEGGSTPVWVRVRVTDPETGQPIPLGPAAGLREVNRGEVVRVEVLSGRAVIAYDSVAESSGRTGETVLVASPDKKRHLLARVEEKGKVSIRR